MKANPETRAKKAAAAINQVKMTKHSFMYDFNTKKDELVDFLRKCECPYPVAIAASLVRQNLVKKEAGLYTFMTSEPIHYKIILNDLNHAAKTACDSARKQYNKTVKTTETKTTTVVEAKIINDDEVINYLKNKGYRILRPVTNFEEC